MHPLFGASAQRAVSVGALAGVALCLVLGEELDGWATPAPSEGRIVSEWAAARSRSFQVSSGPEEFAAAWPLGTAARGRPPSEASVPPLRSKQAAQAPSVAGSQTPVLQSPDWLEPNLDPPTSWEQVKAASRPELRVDPISAPARDPNSIGDRAAWGRWSDSEQVRAPRQDRVGEETSSALAARVRVGPAAPGIEVSSGRGTRTPAVEGVPRTGVKLLDGDVVGHDFF